MLLCGAFILLGLEGIRRSPWLVGIIIECASAVLVVVAMMRLLLTMTKTELGRISPWCIKIWFNLIDDAEWVSEWCEWAESSDGRTRIGMWWPWSIIIIVWTRPPHQPHHDMPRLWDGWSNDRARIRKWERRKQIGCGWLRERRRTTRDPSSLG